METEEQLSVWWLTRLTFQNNAKRKTIHLIHMLRSAIRFELLASQ